jgi:hypothetical protein
MPLYGRIIGAFEQLVLSLVVDADLLDQVAVISDLGQASVRVSAAVCQLADGPLFSVSGEDADGVVPGRTSKRRSIRSSGMART